MVFDRLLSKKTPNMFLITKNQEIFLLSKERKKKAHEREMLIFHPDISPFPKPARRKRGTTAPSTPQDVILGVQSHGGCLPGLIWVLVSGGNAKCVPPLCSDPLFQVLPHCTGTWGCREDGERR